MIMNMSTESQLEETMIINIYQVMM